MNMEESSRGSSCNGQENGDGFNGSDRPLKKARFAWQVKGKHHLKNNDPAKISTTESTVPEKAICSGSGSNSSNIKITGTEQDTKTEGGLRDYLLNKDIDTLDSVVYEPDKSGNKPIKTNLSTEIDLSSGISLSSEINPMGNIITQRAPEELLFRPEDILSPTRNISPNEDEDKDYENIEDRALTPILPMRLKDDGSGEMEFVPLAEVIAQRINEDRCIARWQARQLAKGPLDNKINSVLDYIKQNPLEEEEDNAALEAFDVLEDDFINNLPEPNNIENEGILMAISAHGLQNTSNSSSSSSSYNSCTSNSMSLEFEDIYLPSFNISPVPSDDESPATYDDGLDDWTYTNQLKDEDSETRPSPTFNSNQTISIRNIYENFQNRNAASNDVAMDDDDHRDFLDTAVLFAIQSKGLTTFGTDYG